MKIVCPQCEFTREVATEKLPSTSVMATCPQCQHRFKVSRPEELQTHYKDDTVPQGAHIPEDYEPAEHKPAVSAPQNDFEAEEAQKTSGTEHDTPQDNNTAQDDEEEARAAAAAAYAKQAEESFIIRNPWEDPYEYGYFSAFYQTAVRVMFAAPRFFAGLIPQSARVRALIFYLIVTVLQITFERFWGGIISSYLTPSAAEYPDLQVVIQLLQPKTSLILAILIGSAISIVEIFVSTALFFVLFRLVAPKNVNFDLIFQVIAYSSAPVLLAIVPAIGSMVGFVWGLACLAIGCRYAMRLSWQQTLLGILPFYLIAMPLFLQIIFS